MTSSSSPIPKDSQSKLGISFPAESERRHPSHRRLRDKLIEHALTQARVGVAVVEPGGQLTDANSALGSMFGYPSAELFDLNLNALVHETDRDRLTQLIVAISTAVVADATAEIRYIGRDGVSFWGRTHLALFKQATARDGLLLIIENIDRLKSAEERLELAIDAADLGVFEWQIDTDELISESPRTREILNYPDSLAVRRLSDIILADDLAAFELALQDALQQPTMRFHHVCRIRAQGAAPLKWIEIVGQVRCEPTEGSSRLVGILTDITTRKMTQQALQDADTRKNQFLTVLAHELRNPLAPIKTAALLVQRLTPEHEARVQSAAQMIERQSAHLSDLVEQLLEVTRISTGNIELSREIVDLSGLLNDAAESMALLIDNRRQTLALSVPAVPIWVDIDAVRMTQVLTNLIDNASRYTADGGSISVTATQGSGLCEIRVIDNGQGVSPELLPHIFDPFIQGKVSAARTNAGLGIGLSIVQQLLALHGGRVRGESAGTGHGSTFIVTLPLAEPPILQAPSSATLFESSDLNAGVLIVDDNADAAESLAELLSLAGYTVQTAGNAAETFQRLSQWQPAVIVLDIGLPDLDGFEITLRLRATPQTAKVLIIALSGYGSAEYLARAEAVGIDLYLTKPAPIANLIAAIQSRQRAAA